MPTELEELVEFLHHGNTEIRQIATQNLVPYSKTKPSIFKTAQLRPVKDLKLLIRDYAPIAQHALTILINISGDGEILTALAEDEGFLESVLGKVTNPKERNADSLCMLLANLSKSDSLSRLLGLKRAPVLALSPSSLALDQLTHLFNRGANKGYNSASDYDYLAYLFADLAKFPPIATYLTSPSPNDPLSLPPLTLLTPFTTYPSTTRRLGLSSLLYNLSLSLPSSGIPPLLSPPLSILPQLLLPLCGPDPTFSETEIESLLPELQLLGNDHHREPDFGILKTLVETVYVLVGKGGKEVRTGLKEAGTYLVVRELHLEIEDEAVRAACEKVVDLLMIDEEDGRVSSLVSERQKDEEEEEKAKAITKPLNPADPAKESRVSEEIPKTTTTTITASTPSTQEETTQTSTKLPPPNYSSPIPIPPLPVTIINKDDNNNNNNNNNDSEDEEEEEDNNRIVDIF